MALSVIKNPDAGKHFGLFRRLAINHAHPTKLVLDIIAFTWMSYFLWEHHLLAALLFGSCFSLLGTVLTLGADTAELSITPFGRYVMARLHPANLTCQVSGYLIGMYGLWAHTGWIILAGLTAVTLGHLWGWRRKVIP